MIIATALIKGFKSEISSKMFGFWGHIHITSSQQTTSLEPSPITINPRMIESLKGLKKVPESYINLENSASSQQKNLKKGSKGGVSHVQTFAQKAGIIKTKDNFEGIILKGVGQDFDWRFVESCLVEGRKIMASDSSNDILVSKSTANRLELKVGQKFIVHFVKNNKQEPRLFQVCGIYNTGIEEYDKKFALVDLAQVQTLLGWQSTQIGGLEVFVENLDDLASLNDYIYNELITNDLYAQTIREEQPSIFDWLDLQDVNETVILGLMLLVSIINMVTALLILILERTNMIGSLKALGSTNWQIQRVFLFYGMLIMGFGLAIGNGVGLLVAWLEQKYKFIRLPEADYYLSYAPIKFDWLTIAGLNFLAFLVTSLFLILPTLLVMTISPVRAIRFK